MTHALQKSAAAGGSVAITRSSASTSATPRRARAGVPFFFKQWGGFQKKKNGRDLDGRTWDEMPLAAAG